MVSDLHIGVLAFPFGTHAALVRRLSASVPNTRFSFFSSTVSNSTLFNERISDSYDNIQPYNVRDGTPEGFSGSHFEAVDLFLDAASGNFEKAIGEAEEETGMKICCLISDAFLWFGGDLAAKRGIPWVPFWTAASCSLSVHVYTDEILKAVGSTGKSVLLYLDLDISGNLNKFIARNLYITARGELIFFRIENLF
ncbi:UNVERIFIED_CONTAM: Anthocyanidin 3-O-glucosyltransferase [Sesamum radiatum]|uniref:Anthocyanidin 3-O-glucosyltransferase n=1 Tax=Sesamum radiatum TaxID=300843 RepID=A0AAW2NA64_SESRA